MKAHDLAVWRKKFRNAKDISEAKAVGRAFKNKFQLDLPDHEILELLRDGERFFGLLLKVID